MHINYQHGGNRYGREVSLDYSVNLNPLGMPETARSAALEGIRHAEYYPDPYAGDLLAAAAASVRLPQEQFLAGNGATELLFAAVRTLGRPVLTAGPAFDGYREAAEAAGLPCEEVLFTDEDRLLTHAAKRPEACILPSEAFLEHLLRRQAETGSLLILCNPNNPTGGLLPAALLKMVVEACEREGLPVLIDESFLPLSDGAETASVLPLLSSSQGLLVLRSLTKQYAMPGLRLGLLLSADTSLLSRIRRTLQPWNVSLPAQLAGAAALRDEACLREALSCISRERGELIRALRVLPGLTVLPSATCFLLLHGPEDLGERLLEEGILIRDCSAFRGLGRGWFRLAVKRAEENRILVEKIRNIVTGC